MRQAPFGFMPFDKWRTRSSRLSIKPPADCGMDMRFLAGLKTLLQLCELTPAEAQQLGITRRQHKAESRDFMLT
jgi:hypothetical protein